MAWLISVCNRCTSLSKTLPLLSVNFSSINQPPEESDKDARVDWSERRRFERFGHTEWRPKKRLTRYQMDHLKELHKDYPGEWTLGKLSKKFHISHSAVKRILRSKFEPTDEIKTRQDQKAVEQKNIRRNTYKINNQ